MKILRRLCGALTVIVFAYSGYWLIRLAAADHYARNCSGQTIDRAVLLAPGNSEYYVRLAELHPDSAPAAIRRAVELNPMNSTVWLEFAQVMEDHQDYQAAERGLLHAVQLDRASFAPRWLLAKYYFRRQDRERFWPSIRAALDASHDDVTPLFEMCWKLAPDSARILQDAMPSRPDVLRHYLDFLVAQNRLDLANPAVEKLVQHPAKEDVESLLGYCDLLLSKGQLMPALKTWNALASKRLLPHSPLAPAQGVSLTNGQFAFPILSRGFDWRLSRPDAVLARQLPSPASVRFDFSGEQPEDCELLSQLLPLESSRKYRLSIIYRTAGLSGNSGLRWYLVDSATEVDLLPQVWLQASEDSQFRQQILFSVPFGARLGRLILRYKRIPGTTLIEGALSLFALELDFAE
jgi:tetratricopeptide (TPR) repeat protein